MDFSQSYFELFGIDQGFDIDRQQLAHQYRQLQKKLHPDNFADKSAAEQRLSVQFASHINLAYQVLNKPLSRAEYLLELSGYPLNSDTLTIQDGEFLFKQMDWREELSELSGKVDNKELDGTEESVNDLMKWLRKPTIYGLVIFDMLVILLLVHWSYGYIRYMGFILLLIFINKCYYNPMEMPKIVRQYFGMDEQK